MVHSKKADTRSPEQKAADRKASNRRANESKQRKKTNVKEAIVRMNIFDHEKDELKTLAGQIFDLSSTYREEETGGNSQRSAGAIYTAKSTKISSIVNDAILHPDNVNKKQVKSYLQRQLPKEKLSAPRASAQQPSAEAGGISSENTGRPQMAVAQYYTGGQHYDPVYNVYVDERRYY